MTQSLNKLVAIAKDEAMFPEVLKSLYSTLKENKEYNNELRKALSLNPNCPIEVLEKLSKDEIVDIRINTAKHSKSNKKILQTCAKDANCDVKLAVLQNENITEDILILLLKEENVEVSKLARAILKQKL